MTAPDAPQVEPLTLTLEEAIVELAKYDHLSLRCYPASFGVPAEWAALSPAGWVRGSGDAWHEAVSEALGRPVVPRDDTAELAAALEAWLAWAAKHQADLYFGDLSESSFTQVGDLVATSRAALARVKGKP